VQTYVVDHLGAALSTDELAAATRMSVRSFSRHFVEESGITPREFVERARVDAARNLLEAGGAPAQGDRL
jgi:transcriptional regulator GlxA family with amidase domain